MSYQIAKGLTLEEIDTPALLVDDDQLRENISRMAAFFADKAADLRPHIKTHKCPQIANLQLREGAVGLTCAKLSEAEVFAEAGIEDILIANQITGETKLNRLTDLARRCDLKVAVDDARNVAEMDRACREKGVRIGVLIEVDIGMKRCGVPPGEPTVELVRNVASREHLDYLGLQAYEGHLVLVEDPEERAEKVIEAFAPLGATCQTLEDEGLSPQIVSGGGTGTYQTAGTRTPLTEIQAGSYVFMDDTYRGVRPEFPPAISVFSTVVSRPVPERLVTDAGLKSMTSEFGWPKIVGAPSAKMEYLSEEHAVLTLKDPQASTLRGGDKVQFLPSHVCTTVNLHDKFYVHRDGVVVDVWTIDARGCVQ